MQVEFVMRAGEVHGTWWCSKCHNRHGGFLEACRMHLRMFEIERNERTNRHFDALHSRQGRHRVEIMRRRKPSRKEVRRE